MTGDGYTTKTVTAMIGWAATSDGIKPVTTDRHVVVDGGRTVAVCADEVHAERIATLLNEHGLVDVEELAP